MKNVPWKLQLCSPLESDSVVLFTSFIIQSINLLMISI